MKGQFRETESNGSFGFDTNGGFVTELDDSRGRPVFFPKTVIGEKVRGGSHVCLPNFGPDSSGELAQHGFGRTSNWQVLVDDTDEDGVRVVELKLDVSDVPVDYQTIDARLQYWCGPNHFSMRLTTLNGGTQPMRIAPGFHPYFMVDGPVTLNGQVLDLSAYNEAQLIDGSQHSLELSDRRIDLSSETLTKWALWTDQPDKYFCVEPTLAGPSFDQPPKDDELIASGRLKSYDFTIAWGHAA